ncbi:uncharacterized protein PpBr36_10236 [Pyricularia pennisetigena]|uniref:uncharacterized protein n=1 Tax=Pyricularia pennisetigena TaxID=1578925 RepID=UPI00114F3C0D|nr:uncharacterized protein PpBr36_10236 [Pyricularia pennisetigena]TLS21507.1 hypothetical protein PpBr36_10236 [Pyricularia pennisetigena]
MLFPSLPFLSVLLSAASLGLASPHPQRPMLLESRQQGPVKYEVKKPPLDTDWTYKLGTNPWPEHPRPLLKRADWQTLNGIWTFRKTDSSSSASPPPSGLLDMETMIPSCVESGLSGLQELDAEYMWFARRFSVPEGWRAGGKRVLLNFEAVDYESRVFVNGKELARHVGGYFRYSVDVTDSLATNGTDNLLTVWVRDPTDRQGSFAPVGKQTVRPSHIFYRACSGIWQTVWLESVPASGSITQLDVAAGSDGKVTVKAHSSVNGTAAEVEVKVTDASGAEVGSGKGSANTQFQFTVDSPKLWWPESPTLYNLTVKMGEDSVSSYTAFRTVSRGEVGGIQRPLLNGEFVFQFGTLDQGFWPDGLHTPPNYEAMVSDLKLLKSIGMNMVRKHIKIEPDLFYRACDELGLMVIQDMPSMSADGRQPNDAQQDEFGRQLELMIEEHKSYPSIVTWVIYNEGWAQRRDGPPWPEDRLSQRVRALDPTRLIDAVSGWNDHGFGDFSDNHHYASPQCGTPFYSQPAGPHDSARIGFQGEFGGLGMNTTIDHLWNVPDAIRDIPQTYEIHLTGDSYNYRASQLLNELAEQVKRFECSGAVYTQTSDVEGEVNGLVTYDRRVTRIDKEQWKKDIQRMYDEAAKRGGRPVGGK